MSTITTAEAVTPARVPTWRSGIGTGVVAAGAVSAVVVALRAAGVPLEGEGEPLPLAAFARWSCSARSSAT